MHPPTYAPRHPWGRTVRCARAVRKVGYFGPVSPDGRGDRSNCCVPMRRTAQILTQSKNSDDELKQTTFHTENATSLSECAVFAPWTQFGGGGKQCPSLRFRRFTRILSAFEPGGLNAAPFE